MGRRGSEFRPVLVALAVGAATLAMVIVLSSREAPAPEPASVSEAIGGAHENLNATAWVQTSAEYAAAAMQSYALAESRMLEGLADPGWTAAIEQERAGGFDGLPPAVILDLDETVLDNSAYQARQILDGTEFTSASWNEWVREERAGLLPGAAGFVAAAQANGVALFWVTNRSSEVEEPTRANLLALGLPVSDAPDTLLTSGERAEWTSDKGTRRSHVAATHRIVLLIGDNLGDFLSDVNRDRETRARAMLEREAYWGRRWIVLPNPQYGSWDGALIDYQYGLPWAEKRSLKVTALDPAREERR